MLTKYTFRRTNTALPTTQFMFESRATQTQIICSKGRQKQYEDAVTDAQREIETDLTRRTIQTEARQEKYRNIEHQTDLGKYTNRYLDLQIRIIKWSSKEKTIDSQDW